MTSTIVDFPKENTSLNERLNELEDFYVNSVLSDELKETFFDIKKECNRERSMLRKGKRTQREKSMMKFSNEFD